MVRLLIIVLSFVYSAAANAENWQLKDSGVGLIIED